MIVLFKSPKGALAGEVHKFIPWMEMFERFKWAKKEQGDFFLIALLFVSFRLFSLLLFRPGGFILEWSGYYIPEQGFIQLSDRGLYPFIHYWMEYPPLYPWLAVLAYRLSLLIPPWVDARLWFNLIFGVILLLFEVGNFILIYALAHKLYGPREAIRCAWFYALLFVPLFTLMGWFDSFPLFFLLLGLCLVINGRAALSGLATGVGFMIKPFPLLVAPLALRALPKISQKAIYVGIACLVALLIATPFLLINAPLLFAAFINTFSLAPWETIWALLDSYYSGGPTKPFSERFDPTTAGVDIYVSRLPWLWISLAFALLYLVLYIRRLDWRNGRNVVAFGGLTVSLFLIYSKGWSPQWLVYILPFITLLLPNLRGVTYVILFTLANFLEFPIALVVLPKEHWLLATAIILRTALLALLCLECGLTLWPSVAIEKVRRVAFATLLALALLGGPLIGVSALRAYVGERYSQDPYRESMAFLRSMPSGVLLFTEQSLYRRFYPFVGRGKELYLLEDVGRLAEIVRGHPSIWVVYAGGEKDREANAKVERWLSENSFPVTTRWFPNCRLSGYSSAPLLTAQPREANFEGQILLTGYAFDKASMQPGRVFPLALHWRALSRMETDYTVFVHLLDSAGRVLSQRDSQPVNGFRPTSTWAAGEEVADYHGLPLPADIPAGEYWLEVGLYEAATGKRLLTETRQEDRILLGPIRIMR